MGAPKKYNNANRDEINRLGYELALLGLSEKEMAGVLDVSKSTINNWKKDYPEFLDSIRKGRAQADAKVSRGLYRSATGYRTMSVKFNHVNMAQMDLPNVDDFDNLSTYELMNLGKEMGITDATIEIKEHGPNGNDAIKWLSNRRRHDEGINWRLNPDNEPEDDPLDGTPIEYEMVLPDGSTLPFNNEGDYLDFQEEEE